MAPLIPTEATKIDYLFVGLYSKTPKFCMKNWKRPTIGDIEIYNLDPQLHQIFKPIRKFSALL